MKIKQDPITKLWCREDGAILMPAHRNHSNPILRKFRWTFGTKQPIGYRTVGHRGRSHTVHQIVCRAFHGTAPTGKPFVDHINLYKSDNRPSNLHWVDHKENMDNRDYVDKSAARHGVRQCEDKKAYFRVHDALHRAKMRALGFTKRKGPDGKWGWYPKAHP